MKKFIKDWWPLLLIAGWWLWKRNKKSLPKDNFVQQTVTLHDGSTYVVPDVCPRCGSTVDHNPGNNSLLAKCTEPTCSYSVYRSKEGQEAGICKYCGSTMHYRTVRSTADGASIINFAVCDNPNCQSHSLLY